MAIRKDEDSWFNLPREIYAFNEGARNRFQVKFDFTTQFNKNNLLKTGIDYIDYSVWARNYSDELNRRELHYIGHHHQTGKPVKPKQFAWYIQDKMEYKGLVLNAGVRMDHFDPSVKHPLTTAMAASDYFFDTFTRFNYDSLESFGLLEKDFPIAHIHGKMTQDERDTIVNEFRQGKTRLLLITGERVRYFGQLQ